MSDDAARAVRVKRAEAADVGVYTYCTLCTPVSDCLVMCCVYTFVPVSYTHLDVYKRQ